VVVRGRLIIVLPLANSVRLGSQSDRGYRQGDVGQFLILCLDLLYSLARWLAIPRLDQSIW
jgi:hypothetical protein